MIMHSFIRLLGSRQTCYHLRFYILLVTCLRVTFTFLIFHLLLLKNIMTGSNRTVESAHQFTGLFLYDSALVSHRSSTSRYARRRFLAPPSCQSPEFQRPRLICKHMYQAFFTLPFQNSKNLLKAYNPILILNPNQGSVPQRLNQLGKIFKLFKCLLIQAQSCKISFTLDLFMSF